MTWHFAVATTAAMTFSMVQDYAANDAVGGLGQHTLKTAKMVEKHLNAHMELAARPSGR